MSKLLFTLVNHWQPPSYNGQSSSNSKSLKHDFIHSVNRLLIGANNCGFLPRRVLKFLRGAFHDGIHEFHACLQSTGGPFTEGGYRYSILWIRGCVLFNETHLIELLEQFLAKYIIQVLPTNLDFCGSKQQINHQYHTHTSKWFILALHDLTKAAMNIPKHATTNH